MKSVLLVLSLMLAVGAPAVAQDHTDVVAAVKAALVQRGQTFTTNCDAFEITRRVAWILRGEGALLIGKSAGQNGCEFGDRTYSHDALALPTGWRDLLESAGPPANLNGPAWAPTGASPTAPLYPPFDPGDGIVTPPPPIVSPPVVVPPPPVLPPPLDLSAVLAKLDALQLQLKEHDENPHWLAKTLENRYVQLGLAAFATWLTTQKVAQ